MMIKLKMTTTKREMNHRHPTKRMTFLIPFPVKLPIDNLVLIIDYEDEKNGI